MGDKKGSVGKQTIHGACKFRLYPTEDQKTFFKKQFGCCRFVYNYLLIRMQKAYNRRKESISNGKAKKFISVLKKTRRFEFLKEVNSQSLQSTAINLGKARKKFFDKEGGYPKLKKKNGRQSFEVPQNFLLKKTKRGKYYLIISKLKSSIKIKVHREIPGEIRHIVISMDPDGRYYASINYREKKDIIISSDTDKSEKTAGYDLGVGDLYVDDEGKKTEAPRYYRKAEKKLSKEQRKHSRKKKGSKNKEKARLKVAKTHSKIKNKRRDFIHKQSNKIVNKNQVIYFETLNVKGMMRNHCLAKSVVDAMLGELIRQVKYKARWRNKKLIQIGRFEPSSKLCSNCGFKNNDLKLHHRVWKCKECGTLHDRDVNAAKNIKKIGQEIAS